MEIDRAEVEKQQRLHDDAILIKAIADKVPQAKDARSLTDAVLCCLKEISALREWKEDATGTLIQAGRTAGELYKRIEELERFIDNPQPGDSIEVTRRKPKNPEGRKDDCSDEVSLI